MHLPEISREVRDYFSSSGFSISRDAADDAARLVRDLLGGDSAGSVDDVDADAFAAACRWADCGGDSGAPATDFRGVPVDFEAAVQLMDDGLREEVHAAMAPCSQGDFLDVYAAAHELRFGEPFAPYVGAAW